MRRERRKYIRVSQRLTIVPWPSKQKLDAPWVSKEISAGGIRLLTNHRLKIGEKIGLGIYLPEFKKPLLVKGEVLSLQKLDNDIFNYMVRMKFINVDHNTHMQLLSHIQYCVLRV